MDVVVAVTVKSFTNTLPLCCNVSPITGVPVIVTSANPVRFCAPALEFGTVL